MAYTKLTAEEQDMVSEVNSEFVFGCRRKSSLAVLDFVWRRYSSLESMDGGLSDSWIYVSMRARPRLTSALYEPASSLRRSQHSVIGNTHTHSHSTLALVYPSLYPQSELASAPQVLGMILPSLCWSSIPSSEA